MSTADDAYLTTAEALEYLHTTPRTLYRRLAKGDIPAVRIGHQWRFRKRDLDRWLEQQATGRAAPADVTRSTPSTSVRARILVADDEPAVRETVADILAMTECEVELVPDGPTAVSRLRAQRYALVITDLRMPGLDGIAVAREAKRLWPGIKVVIITAYPSQSSAIDAVNIGVDGYLMKPFRPIEVLIATARTLGLGLPDHHERSL
jgi:excisionase family DNA binding protein